MTFFFYLAKSNCDISSLMKNNIIKGSCDFKFALSSLDQIKNFRNEFISSSDKPKGIAILGRSNVGKSSLINALFGKGTARISKTPGRTREVIIFKFQTTINENKSAFFLFDLPGYGHAKVSKAMLSDWQKIMDLFLRLFSDKLLFLLIQDARHPNMEADQQLINYLKNSGMDAFLVLNKIDKLKTQKEKNELKKMIPTLSKKYKMCRQIYFVSAESKSGLELLEESILAILSEN